MNTKAFFLLYSNHWMIKSGESLVPPTLQCSIEQTCCFLSKLKWRGNSMDKNYSSGKLFFFFLPPHKKEISQKDKKRAFHWVMLGQSKCFWIWSSFFSYHQPSAERWKPQFDELQIRERRAANVATFQNHLRHVVAQMQGCVLHKHILKPHRKTLRWTSL